ncbi:MAG: YegP family protein [Maricaulaceae bacterium]|jgi:uncharacterized protein YegP (UPF0339 family)
MPGKFEVYKDKRGEFRFRLKATNGQIILASEGYKTKASCTNGIASVRKNAKKSRFEVKTKKSGKPHFVLTAPNGEVIGTSQVYASTATCNKGIQSVIKNAPGAKVEGPS